MNFKLNPTNILGILSGIFVTIALFMTWATEKISGAAITGFDLLSFDGTKSTLMLLVVILGILIIVFSVLRIVDILPKISRVVLIVAGVMVILLSLVVFIMLSNESVWVPMGPSIYVYNPEIGGFVSIIAGGWTVITATLMKKFDQ